MFEELSSLIKTLEGMKQQQEELASNLAKVQIEDKQSDL
jgi:hypothetical protein